MKSSYDVLRRVDGVEVVDAVNPGRQRTGAAARLPTERRERLLAL